MGKTCLNTLQGSILTTCKIPVHGIKNIYLLPVNDVSLTFSPSGSVLTATFVPGTGSHKVEGYKQNIQVTTAIRALDASTKMDISIIFKVPATMVTQSTQLLSGRFYVMIETNDMEYYFAGSTSPLECSGYDLDLNTNGQLATVTLSAPDGSAGNYLQSVGATAINTILTNIAF